MLKFDITTPFEKYNEIVGRFGFMEEDRHVVCMVTYPTGSTGIEVKLVLDNFTHFDVIFHLATPIDFLQKVLAIGKIQEEEVRLFFSNLNPSISIFSLFSPILIRSSLESERFGGC